jgi:hypothetical protein
MKRSNHYGDIKLWIEKIIDSSITKEQLFCVGKLINQFEKKLYKSYPVSKHNGLFLDIIKPLKDYSTKKYKKILMN